MVPTVKQAEKMRIIALASCPVPVQELRASNITINRMVKAFWVQKVLIDGRSHYRLTERGIRALAKLEE